MKKIISYFFCACAVIQLTAFEAPSSRVKGAILGSALGDALGRIPEQYWIAGGKLGTSLAEKMCNQWRSDFPKGISSFADFRAEDFEDGVAIYTDDTQMAMLVFKGLYEYCSCLSMEEDFDASDWSSFKSKIVTDDLMKVIAENFAEWVVDPNGGLSSKRAPGIGCVNASKRLARDLQRIDDGKKVSHDWWAQGEGGVLKNNKEGGCGSVMRAYPFGIIFAQDIDFACEMAAKHSLLTHRAPMAQAACAAMAAGMVRALEHKDSSVILQEMVTAAKKYDASTAVMIQEAIDYASKELTSEQCAEYLQKLEGRLANQAIAATAFVFAREHEDIRKALKIAINFYGDADSIGAMVGALVGAYVGDEALSESEDLVLLEDSEEFSALACDEVEDEEEVWL